MKHPLIDQLVDRVDDALVNYFRDKDLTCHPLDRAMEYSVLAGGKRMRPLLTLVACYELGGSLDEAIAFSLAPELLHTYSLIHDDLPSMDDDDMRRGKPTNHKVFGEANAILAGDALQTEAIQIIASAPHSHLDDEKRITMIKELCLASGRRGMVAGQVMDMEAAGKEMDVDRLVKLHQRKTGALIRYSVRLGAMLGNADESQLLDLTAYGQSLGLLFQVVDDLLDVEGDSGLLGKTAGKDVDQNKATFPKLIGLEASRKFADGLLDEALQALTRLPQQEKLLGSLANYVRHREY